jgi:hypothetical protein
VATSSGISSLFSSLTNALGITKPATTLATPAASSSNSNLLLYGGLAAGALVLIMAMKKR